ncbi:hypothetical protein [Desulfovibrio cuneatus]|uniref:hypothetical protein n=1 Tax=Desulfovibrio cuneatus TaxID=159728 RepID=UPI0012EB0735|nr:hypothetical protein [Desulfovibrio cuneatus]
MQTIAGTAIPQAPNNDDARMEAARKDLEARVQAAEKAITIDPNKPADPAEDAKEYAEMVKNTLAAQQALGTLTTQLDAMRGNAEFYQRGLSYPPAAEWKKAVEALREKVQHDLTVAPIVRAAPGALLGLSIDREWRRGGITESAKALARDLREALEWKPEE